MTTVRRQARFTGLLYLLLGVTAPIGLLIVPGRLIVRGDAAATAERIRASEWLFRVGIASEWVHQVIGIFVALALYRLFKHVDRRQAALLVILGALVSVPIMFANTINSIAVLTLLGDTPFLQVFDAPERESLAYLFLRLHSRGIDVASVFWGLWLFPMGILAIRSGFIPKFFGYSLFVAGVGYLIAAFTAILFPPWEKAVGQVTGIMVFGELPIIFWLLIAGARGPKADDPIE